MHELTGDPYAPLRRALGREYRLDSVERETADGAVYLAWDLTLHRRVTIRAIDPVQIGPDRAAAFVREARVLASLRHPGLPSVHHAEPLEGFFHVVLEHPGRDTLESRLRQRPMTPPELARLGVELLGALDAIHRAGLAHRAVEPRHVVLAGDRIVLDGLASARPAQAEELSADLWAAARLLVEAAGAEGPGRLPRALRPALRRALSADPAERWTSAAAFRQALLASQRKKGFHPAMAAGAVVLLGGGYLLWEKTRPSPLPPPRELAIVPFEMDGGATLDTLGATIAPLIQLNLEDVPGLQLTPPGQVERWLEAQGGDAQGMDWAEAARDLRAHWVARGLVDRRPGGVWRVRLTLYDSLGTKSVLPEVRTPAGDLVALGDSVTLHIIRVVAPRADRLYEPVAGLATVPLDALKAFLQGEAAFAEDAWALAQRHYEIALAHDSTFAMAEWRLSNVRRWRRLPYEGDLRLVHQRHASRLRPRDRGLIEALLEADLEVRFAKLETAVGRIPSDGYARLLLGDELYHRGPLVGRPLEEAVPVMTAALARDPSLALAHDHLVLAATRFGRREEARASLTRRRALGMGRRSDDLDMVRFLELVYDERFVPWRARLRHRALAWRGDSQDLKEIEKVARMGTLWLDLPHTQLRYCDLLIHARRLSVPTRATAHEGKGLALFALGRLREALAELDSAAVMFDSPEAQLQQAQWRVIPAALGLPDVEPGGRWLRQLETLAADPHLGDRAAWTLALASQSAGDTAHARRWTEQIGAGTPLRSLLEAREAALRGEAGLALARSDSVRLAFQATRPPDAFAGAAFHLLRGEWRASSGDRGRADREWLWYEGADVEGWPTGLAQAGEVDAALGVYARLKRARILLAQETSADDSLRACGHLRSIVSHWARADTTMQPLVREATGLAGQCPH